MSISFSCFKIWNFFEKNTKYSGLKNVLTRLNAQSRTTHCLKLEPKSVCLYKSLKHSLPEPFLSLSLSLSKSRYFNESLSQLCMLETHRLLPDCPSTPHLSVCIYTPRIYIYNIFTYTHCMFFLFILFLISFDV